MKLLLCFLCFLCFLLFLFIGCSPSSQPTAYLPPANPTNSADYFARRSIGRYQLLSDDAGLFKLDTATGQTWQFNIDKSLWQPVDVAPLAAP